MVARAQRTRDFLLIAAGYLAALLAAWLKDYTGGYMVPYTVFMITTAIGAAFIIAAKPPKKQPIPNTV